MIEIKYKEIKGYCKAIEYCPYTNNKWCCMCCPIIDECDDTCNAYKELKDNCEQCKHFEVIEDEKDETDINHGSIVLDSSDNQYDTAKGLMEQP